MKSNTVTKLIKHLLFHHHCCLCSR